MKRTRNNPSFSTTCVATSMKPTRSTGVSSTKKCREDCRAVCCGMTRNVPISFRFWQYYFPAFFTQPQTSFESTLRSLSSQRNRAMAQNSPVAQRQFAIDLVGISGRCNASSPRCSRISAGRFWRQWRNISIWSETRRNLSCRAWWTGCWRTTSRGNCRC